MLFGGRGSGTRVEAKINVTVQVSVINVYIRIYLYIHIQRSKIFGEQVVLSRRLIYLKSEPSGTVQTTLHMLNTILDNFILNNIYFT